jgi:Cupin-like domain
MEASGDFLLWTFLAPLAEEYRKAQENIAFDKVKKKLSIASEATPWLHASLLDVKPEVQEQMRMIIFMRGVLTSPRIAKEQLKSLAQELLEAVAATHDPPKVEPLPSVTLEESSTPEFYRRYIKGSHPVVIRGAFRNVADYSFDALLERYGNERVRFLDMAGKVLWDEFRTIENKPLYLANSERLLSANPELLNGLEPDRYTAGWNMGPSYGTQIFVANRRTGTPAHAGYNNNLFYQLDGTKRWTIVDPAFSCFYYPYIMPTHIDSATDWHTEADRERCPLFRYCPVYDVELYPGDLLFNPWYWLHTVRNTSDRTVGASMRFTPEPGVQIADPSPVATAIRQLGPTGVRQAHAVGFEVAIGNRVDLHDTLLPEGYLFSREEMCDGWGIKPDTGMSVVEPPKGAVFLAS